MKHVSILIPQGNASLSNIEATYKMFTEVNRAMDLMKKAPLFKVQLVGLTKETSLSNGLFIIKPELTIDEVVKTDMVIIPAVHGDMAKVVADNCAFVPWMINI